MAERNLPILRIKHLGLISFKEAWTIQEDLAERIASNHHEPTLLLLEHPHTYTFGRRGDHRNLLWDETQLAEKGVEVHWVDRGGDVTYHGPGQLVGYPLLPLGKIDTRGRVPRADYVGYLRRLEEALIEAIAQLGLQTEQLDGLTGVWVNPEVAAGYLNLPPETKMSFSKIAAIGVKVDSHGITRHGFALNVNPDMNYWDGIIPCGLDDYPGIALTQLLGDQLTTDVASKAVIHSFCKHFGYTPLELPG